MIGIDRDEQQIETLTLALDLSCQLGRRGRTETCIQPRMGRTATIKGTGWQNLCRPKKTANDTYSKADAAMVGELQEHRHG